MKPILLNEANPPLLPSVTIKDSSYSENSVNDIETEKDDLFVPDADSPSHLLSQELNLNDLVRDLELSKQKAELLDSRLQDWNLHPNTKISHLSSPSAVFVILLTGK